MIIPVMYFCENEKKMTFGTNLGNTGAVATTFRDSVHFALRRKILKPPIARLPMI